jgi:hypothetical protein
MLINRKSKRSYRNDWVTQKKVVSSNPNISKWQKDRQKLTILRAFPIVVDIFFKDVSVKLLMRLDIFLSFW